MTYAVLFKINNILPFSISFHIAAILYRMAEHLNFKLINYSDLTQYFLFISLDLSILKVIHSGEIMLNSKRNTYVLTQTDPSYRKLETLCKTKMKTSGCRKQKTKATGFLTFEPGVGDQIVKKGSCSGVKLQKVGPVLE